METSLGDILGLIEKLLRGATTLSGGGCNGLAVEADNGHPYVKVWLRIEGNSECKKNIVGVHNGSLA